MISIKIDDSIVDIIDKIDAQTENDIILDIPLGHGVLHNPISLKILKSKVKNRRLIIATSDKIGRKIGKNLGIEYSHIKSNNFLKETTQGTLLKHNFTYSEYVKFLFQKYFQELKSFLENNKKFNTLSKYSNTYNEKSGIHIFLIALGISILLLFFVYYFAVSKNYITITPEANIKKHALNFTFKENNQNNITGNIKNINIEVLNKEISRSEIYASSGIKSNPTDVSKGKVIIFNELNEEVKLKAKTRLQTTDGLVYEIEYGISLPASLIDNFGNISPGSKEVDVTAQIKDNFGIFTGARGNIEKDTTFILPGLSIDLQNKIYGKSSSDFEGGKDSFEKIVLGDDIERSRLLFLEKLKSEALKEVRSDISKENSLNGTKKEILGGKQSIQYGTPEIFVEDRVQDGVKKDTFILSGSISIQVYIYNRDTILQRLKTLIYEGNLEGVEKISNIDENSLRISEILYTQEKPFEMKATFEIETLYYHDFLHKDNTYIEQLKAKILGVSKEDAIKILVNDPKVSNVEIVIRPFFVHNLSKIRNNIIFKFE